VLLPPLSIGLGFGMLDLGATGETAAALDELFAYPVEGEVVDTEAAGEDETVIVQLANRQFPDEAFEPVARWFDGDAFHTATIVVNEDGTIAAAATASEEPVRSMEAPPPIEIGRVRPVLYLMRHRPTGANLFVGRVLDPSVRAADCTRRPTDPPDPAGGRRSATDPSVGACR
jgi:serine protease inhibitor